jgi:hypothetical protein
MKKRILFSLLVAATLAVNFGFGVQPIYADSSLTVYVVPAISNNKILPTAAISNSYISSNISISACPDEYEPASFVVRAASDITSLQVTAADLVTTAQLFQRAI